MPSGFKTYSASIQVDLDDILKPIGVATPRNNVGFKVGATDISNRYKAATTEPSKLPFNTFFKSGSVDLGQLFMAYDFIEGTYYILTVYSGSGGGSKESASLAPITASAAPSHYSFDTWIGSGITSPASAQTTVLMDAAKIVSASYAVNEYVLTVSDGTGDGTFGYFEDMPITASAAPSYKIFNNWSNTAGSLSFVDSLLAQTIANFTADGNATAAAIYDWIEYDVQATNGAGGVSTVLNGDGSGDVLQLINNSNQQYTLVANPDTHYNFTSWSGNTGGIGNVNAASTYIIVTGNATVASNFALKQYTLTVVFGTGGGTQNYGYSYNIVAGTYTGYTFSNWQTNAGTITYGDVNDPTTTATISSNSTTEAVYDINQYTLTVVDGTGGGTQNYNHTYTINATDYTGYTFANWQVNAGSVSFANQYADTTTCTIGAGNATVESNYNINQYTLTVVYGTGGGLANYENVYNIVATVYTGYTFTNWQTNAGSISYGDINDPTTTATIGAANATTEAIYSANPYTLTVVDGSGGGTQNYAEPNGYVYTITADDYEPAYSFTNWTGAGITFANANNITTTCTIGAANRTATANYVQN
jgi:hypothetical protein